MMCTHTLTQNSSVLKSAALTLEKKQKLHIIIGERSEHPCLLNLSNFRCIYFFIYIFIYIFQAVRHARAVNVQRANVGPACRLRFNGQYNPLKTATLVLSCSERSALPMRQPIC